MHILHSAVHLWWSERHAYTPLCCSSVRKQSTSTKLQLYYLIKPLFGRHSASSWVNQGQMTCTPLFLSLANSTTKSAFWTASAILWQTQVFMKPSLWSMPQMLWMTCCKEKWWHVVWGVCLLVGALRQVNNKGLHQGWTQTLLYLQVIHFTSHHTTSHVVVF